jgi:hypothetical protein
MTVETSVAEDHPENIRHPRLVVVEGQDDEHVFGALITEMNLSGIQVKQVEGRDRLASSLRALTLDRNWSTVTAILVSVDADDAPAAAFQRARDGLLRAGLAAPDRQDEFAAGKLRTCVHVLPGGDQPGMLEDVCLSSVADDPATECVNAFFNCLDAKGRNFTKNPSKARAQVFLASREVPRLSCGPAALKGYWNLDSPAFLEMRRLLQEL